MASTLCNTMWADEGAALTANTITILSLQQTGIDQDQG